MAQRRRGGLAVPGTASDPPCPAPEPDSATRRRPTEPASMDRWRAGFVAAHRTNRPSCHGTTSNQESCGMGGQRGECTADGKWPGHVGAKVDERPGSSRCLGPLVSIGHGHATGSGTQVARELGRLSSSSACSIEGVGTQNPSFIGALVPWYRWRPWFECTRSSKLPGRLERLGTKPDGMPGYPVSKAPIPTSRDPAAWLQGCSVASRPTRNQDPVILVRKPP